MANKDVLKGSRLNYNAGIQAQYTKAIKTLIKQMTFETKKEVTKLFETKTAKEFYENQREASALDASIASQARVLTDKLTQKFNELFDRKAKPLAEKMINESYKAGTVTLTRSFKKLSKEMTLNFSKVPKGTKEVLKAAVTENVALIKSIGSDYLSNVQKLVMRSVTTGQGLNYLIPKLNKFEGISERHAKNMALDQTRKVYNSTNQGRMEAVGIKQFEWLHSGGGHKPRKSHIALSGKVFYFSKEVPINKGGLPVINQEQVNAGYEGPERGIPGQAINCGCTMVPVVTFNTEEES